MTLTSAADLAGPGAVHLAGGGGAASRVSTHDLVAALTQDAEREAANLERADLGVHLTSDLDIRPATPSAGPEPATDPKEQ